MRYTPQIWQFSEQQCTTNISGTELRKVRILRKKLKVCGDCQLCYISCLVHLYQNITLSIFLILTAGLLQLIWISVHRRSSLDPILHQFNPAVTTTSALLRFTAPSRASGRLRTFGCVSCIHRHSTGSSEILEAIYHITRCHKP
jgi:hypothetical protein